MIVIAIAGGVSVSAQGTAPASVVLPVGDSQLRLTALCDVNVIQGEPAEFKLAIPAGFELTDASGSSLESSDLANRVLTLQVYDPAKRNHQFLIAIERPNRETKAEPPLFAFAGAQRETGELWVEVSKTRARS